MARTATVAFSLPLLWACSDKPMVPVGPDAGPTQVRRQPNVILFLADDMGWTDCAVCGSQFYQTPNIDRLARRGMRFTSAYAANPLCSPTRASILTGQYPARLGMTIAAGHELDAVTTAYLPDSAPSTSPRIEPVSSNRLLHEHVTLAEALQAEGYATAHFGKWHLGWSPYEPDSHGFDAAAPGGAHGCPATYFSPYNLPGFEDGPPGEQLDERLAEEAVSFITAHADRPFYLNFWPFSVHGPFEAKPELVDKYSSQVDPTYQQRSPTMAAMLETMDACLGRLIDAVDALGLADDTLIVFFSDNGGNTFDVLDGTAPTSCHPLRGSKGTLYEGGVRVPLIVAWPGVVVADAVSDALVSSIDFLPTLVEMSGGRLAADWVLDGQSFHTVLTQPMLEARDSVFCHFPHSAEVTGHVAGTSVRQGDWKLVRFYADGPDQADRHELYDLANDPGETTNLAAEYPERVVQLDALISQHLAATDALVPIPNPAYVAPTAP